MISEKHTPGPWRVSLKEEFEFTRDDYHQIIALDGPRYDAPGFTITGCISLADAKLIAAAPDMLEALREALKFINGVDFEAPNTTKCIKEAIKRATE